jgi:hypothetical protein
MEPPTEYDTDMKRESHLVVPGGQIESNRSRHESLNALFRRCHTPAVSQMVTNRKRGVDMSARALMTVEQFTQMQTEDTEDYEPVDGELIPLSSGTLRHAGIRDCAGDLIRCYLRGNPSGRPAPRLTAGYRKKRSAAPAFRSFSTKL